MDRKAFLSVGRIAKPIAAEPIVQHIKKDETIRTNSGINPYAGGWTTNEVIHLLKRTMFGAKKADVDFFKTMTMSQAVDYLLNVPTVATSVPVKNYTPGTTTPTTDPDLALAAGQPWANVYTTDGSVNSGRIASYKQWWMGQMINQQRNILEKMVLFWQNHFSTETSVVSVGISSYQTNTTVRKYALGNFKQFVKAITIDPGMLHYLNGDQNRVGAADENYGREMQELFTIGKGPDSHYTETDVEQAARVLTGYQQSYTNGTSVFTASRHDTGNKTFSAFYGNKIITGRTGANGALEVDDLIDMLFSTTELAKFIVRKIYRWFVYYNIDATTEANVITPLADAFRTSGYDIKVLMTKLLKSEHFFDPLNQGCQIKSPVDLYVGMCREMGVVFPVETDYLNAYYMYAFVQSAASSAQQNIGDPINVAGWAPYYQEPNFYEIWLNADTYPKRNQFTDTMVLTGYSRNGKKIMIDAIAFAQTMSNPADPNILIQDCITYMLRLPLSQASMDQLKKDILLTGQISDHYWTDAWALYLTNTANTTNATIVRGRLQNLLKYLMDLPEYQLA